MTSPVPYPYPSVPGLVDHAADPRDNFHPYFTDYSIYYQNLVIPSHVAVYSPDNQDDAQCISVLTPEPSLGAVKWTLNGNWITIGVFRDEGRESGYKPPHESIYWVRSGDQLVIQDTEKHQLILGEEVIHYNTNVGTFTSTVTKIIDDYTFITETSPSGDLFGNSTTGAWYQGTRFVNFHDEYVVFRLLPSFKLVPWSTIKDIFDSSTPSLRITTRTLSEISTGMPYKISSTISQDTNYSTPSVASEISFHLLKRFGQRYDETGTPLKVTYGDNGLPLSNYLVDSKYKNNPLKLNGTIDNMFRNFRVFVYDFYGLEINDPDRGPFFTNDLVYDDPSVSGEVNNIYTKIYRSTDEFGEVLYQGKLFDEFGNVCVGIQDNLALVTRQNILPLSLDEFNHPVKDPVRRLA